MVQGPPEAAGPWPGLPVAPSVGPPGGPRWSSTSPVTYGETTTLVQTVLDAAYLPYAARSARLAAAVALREGRMEVVSRPCGIRLRTGWPG